jgi:hypothetical protein
MNETGVRASTHLHGRASWPVGAIAGLAGGAAEVGWIVIYQNLVGRESGAVARGITQSVISDLVTAPAAVPLGVAIHMVLAILLGVVIASLVSRLLPRIVGTAMEPVVVVLTLVGVWAVNFLVVLPVINPDFVALVPYGASLASKVLFGFAAAFVFSCAHRFRAAGNEDRREANHVQ